MPVRIIDTYGPTAQFSLSDANRKEYFSRKYNIGERYPRDWTPLPFTQTLGTIADWSSYGIMRIISSKLKGILESVPADAQYLPVDIKALDGSLLRHFVFNPVVKCDCIDFAKSECEMLDGGVYRFHKLRLNGVLCKDLPVFMLDRSWVPLICVQLEIARKVESLECRGLKFFAPEEWADGDWGLTIDD